MNTGAKDQAAIEAREDVLVYSSEVLREPLLLMGPVELQLEATSACGAYLYIFISSRVDIYVIYALCMRYIHRLQDNNLSIKSRIEMK